MTPQPHTTVIEAAIYGGLPTRQDRDTLRWLHRDHLRRARLARAGYPFGALTAQGHINEAARIRRAMKDIH